jgi:hypothetical protein
MAVNHVRARQSLRFGMDILTVSGAAMLVLWILGTFVFEGPGLIHLFLTLGVMFIVLGAVKKAERARKGGR